MVQVCATHPNESAPVARPRITRSRRITPSREINRGVRGARGRSSPRSTRDSRQSVESCSAYSAYSAVDCPVELVGARAAHGCSLRTTPSKAISTAEYAKHAEDRVRGARVIRGNQSKAAPRIRRDPRLIAWPNWSEFTKPARCGSRRAKPFQPRNTRSTRKAEFAAHGRIPGNQAKAAPRIRRVPRLIAWPNWSGFRRFVFRG